MIAPTLYARRLVAATTTSFDISWVGYQAAHVASGDNTFSSWAIGDADAGRDIYVSIRSRDMPLPNTVTIGGVSATLIVSDAASANFKESIWSARVASGTSADIVVNYASTLGTFLRATLGVWRVAGGDSTVLDTDVDPASGFSVTADPNGGIIGSAGNYNTGAATWTGLVEDDDQANPTDAMGQVTWAHIVNPASNPETPSVSFTIGYGFYTTGLVVSIAAQ